MRIAELDTPAWLVDLDRLEANLGAMAQSASRAGVNLRPHIKTHKAVEIARMQLALGAGGITCAKVGEAEVMAAAGITDIFIANQIVGAPKVTRLINLVRHAAVRVGIDSLLVARPIHEAAVAAGVTVGVLLEVDVGLGRTGIAPGGVPDLARAIATLPGLRLDGIFSFGGYGSAQPSVADRRQKGRQEAELMVSLAQRLRGLGIPVGEVSVGSTPVSLFAAEVPGITEIRPGTYVFGDVACMAFGTHTEEQIALTVLARIIGRPRWGEAVVDAGTKAIDNQKWGGAPADAGWARVKGFPGCRLTRTWEEHGVISLDESAEYLQVGDLVELIPNHVCPSVNLTDELICHRGGTVEATFRVAARGKVQ